LIAIIVVPKLPCSHGSLSGIEVPKMGSRLGHTHFNQEGKSRCRPAADLPMLARQPNFSLRLPQLKVFGDPSSERYLGG
jgi:hypothetical protein